MRYDRAISRWKKKYLTYVLVSRRPHNHRRNSEQFSWRFHNALDETLETFLSTENCIHRDARAGSKRKVYDLCRESHSPVAEFGRMVTPRIFLAMKPRPVPVRSRVRRRRRRVIHKDWLLLNWHRLWRSWHVSWGRRLLDPSHYWIPKKPRRQRMVKWS